MKNIIIIKDKMVILPYIKKISNIRVDMHRLSFYFEVESMVTDDVLIYCDKFDNELTPYTGLLFLSSIPDGDFVERYKISDKNNFSIDEDVLYNDLKSKYDDLNNKREVLISKWDKSLSKIKKI